MLLAFLLQRSKGFFKVILKRGLVKRYPGRQEQAILINLISGKPALKAWTAESPMNNIEVFHFVQIRGQ